MAYQIYHPRNDGKGSAFELDFNPAKKSVFITIANQLSDKKEFGWPGRKDEQVDFVRIRLELDDITRLADSMPRPQEGKKENGSIVLFNTFHDRYKGDEEQEGTDTASMKVVAGKDPLARFIYLNRKNGEGLKKTSIALQKHEWRSIILLLNRVIERIAL